MARSSSTFASSLSTKCRLERCHIAVGEGRQPAGDVHPRSDDLFRRGERCRASPSAQEHFRLQRFESGNALVPPAGRRRPVPLSSRCLACFRSPLWTKTKAAKNRLQTWDRRTPSSSSSASIASHSPSARPIPRAWRPSQASDSRSPTLRGELRALEAQFQGLAVAIAEGDDRREVSVGAERGARQIVGQRHIQRMPGEQLRLFVPATAPTGGGPSYSFRERAPPATAGTPRCRARARLRAMASSWRPLKKSGRASVTASMARSASRLLRLRARRTRPPCTRSPARCHPPAARSAARAET